MLKFDSSMIDFDHTMNWEKLNPLRSMVELFGSELYVVNAVDNDCWLSV